MALSEMKDVLASPENARYEAEQLWKQGLRSGDRVAIMLSYGFNDQEADVLCSLLDTMQGNKENID